MKTQAQEQSVALFFYFAHLDEPLAQGATIGFVNKLKAQAQDSAKIINLPNEKLIEALNEAYRPSNKKIALQKGGPVIRSGWELPTGLDIAPWKQFKKEALKDEFIAVIFSKILSFSDAELSKGLNISEGTLRHRLNRGLSLLSHLILGDEK